MNEVFMLMFWRKIVVIVCRYWCALLKIIFSLLNYELKFFFVLVDLEWVVE